MTQRSLLGMLPAMKLSMAAAGFGLGSSLLAGCTGGTETGNPVVVTGSLSYTGHSSAPEHIGVGEGGDVATVSSAWFQLERVGISTEGCGSGRGQDFDVAALGLGDHAAGAHVSTAYSAEAGIFCSLELPFVSTSEETAAPDELRGHAILLTGELADGTEFSIVSDAQPRLLLEAEASGFELAEGVADALVAFDFATWLDAIDFASAAVDGSDIAISATSNSGLLEQFESNLAAGVVLYRDAGADGVLDARPEELARVR